MNHTVSYNYQKYHSRNPLVQLAIRRFFSVSRELLLEIKAENILDVGCGEGFHINYLTKNYPLAMDITGIDCEYDVLSLAKKINPSKKFVQANACSLPYKDKSFDVVTCLEVLEHIETVNAALSELCRVAREYCLLSIPHEPFFSILRLLGGKDILRLGRHPQHLHQFSVKKAVKIFKDYFKIKKTVTAFPWVFILGEVK